jgi:hypothetical protein
VLNLRLADNAQIEPEFRSDMLKGVVVPKGKAPAVTKNADGSTGGQKEQDFLAIPYYVWAHCGPGEWRSGSRANKRGNSRMPCGNKVGKGISCVYCPISFQTKRQRSV